MEKTKINHDGIINLEQPLIKVPLEQFRKSFRTSQKLIEKEMQILITSVEDLAKSHPNQTILNDCKIIDSMVNRIQALKRKLDETKFEEAMYAKRTKQRIDHLLQLTNITTVDSEEYKRWSRLRLERIIVEYMLRNGCSESAEKLANDAGIRELVDIELFAQARKIEDGLRRKSCFECLTWCGDNRSNLRKMKVNYIDL
ncbi:GID complex subunit containing RING finger motif [Nowakowskiella sp. JEL0078]|nr:GID complex subunit containing RING finger motif [Nowakowskiella sp. JEL0078]